MQHWYNRFGLVENPFELDPFKSSYTFVNHKALLEELLYLVKSGNMFVLQGESGSGKTIFLRQIVSFFEGEKKVVYVDCQKLGDKVNIEELIYKRKRTVFHKLFVKKPQNMIVLLDNVEKLSEKNCEKIKYYFDQGHIRSVIFATKDFKNLKLNASVHDRILNQVLPIPPLNQYDALRIVRDRFRDHFFLADETILELFELANRNMKETLIYCENLCSYAAKNGKGEAMVKHIPVAIQTPVPKTKSKSHTTNTSKTATEA